MLAQSGAVDATPEDDALDGGEVRAASAKQNTAPPITDVPDGTESSNEPSNAQGATTIPEDEDADEEHT